MDYSLLIPSLLLTAIGLLILFRLLFPLVRALYMTISFQGILETRRVNSCVKRQRKAEILFSEGNHKEAVSFLSEALYLDLIRHHEHLLPKIHEYNLALLADLVQHSDSLRGSLKSVPLLEELLEARSRLQRSLFDSRMTAKIRKKQRRREGKKQPDWATKEFSQKEQRLRKELKENRKMIQGALDLLRESSPDFVDNNQSITYH